MTALLLDYEPTMHPIGAQLCGSSLELAGQCAEIIEKLGFDVLDFNCGCPVDKITKDGSGSGMLKNPELIGKIVEEMVRRVKIPVTVKIRLGWDERNIVAPLLTRIVEEAGASALAIHGRCRKNTYADPIRYDLIAQCKAAAKKMPIIGNGNIFDPISAEKMFVESGCDAILLSRGLLGQPWLVDDIYRHFQNEPALVRSPLDLREAFLDHLERIVRYFDERKAALLLRKVGCWFFRNAYGMTELRDSLNRTESVAEIRQLVHNFEWK
jgi:tRNA-dihydrouridine synthase B